MSGEQLIYLVFGGVLLLALVFDLGLISKKGKEMTTKQALFQTLFWVALALAFGGYLWYEETNVHGKASGTKTALEYISAYLMEWSLSIDNIFVFILIFNAFKIKKEYLPRTLLVGILMAIVFRIIFITIGVALVEKFEWILLIFGAFLIFTGIKMFTAGDEEEFEPKKNIVYRFLQKILPLTQSDGGGKYSVIEAGKRRYTTLFVVVILLAAIDIVFALDSIPAVMGISQHRMVIYTSNIFAVLGLRSLFFLLKSAVSKFDYLQQGIAIVLVFIGVKMAVVTGYALFKDPHYIDNLISPTYQTVISLGVILICISGSIIYSIYRQRKGVPADEDDNSL